MSRFLMVLTDSLLEGSFTVVADSKEVLARAAVTYLRYTRPLNTTTGHPLEVPAYLLDAAAWLDEVLIDVDDIEVEITGEGGLYSPAEFLDWIGENSKDLQVLHRRLDKYQRT